MLGVVVTTQYRPRTDVERWQIQDRLILRLRRLGCPGRPRFFEADHGRLAFHLRLGPGRRVDLLRALQAIDDAPGASDA